MKKVVALILYCLFWGLVVAASDGHSHLLGRTLFFAFGVLLFSMVMGGIGALIGKQVQKQSQGFWYGAFLGTLGWIIVLLLPKNGHPKNTNNSRIYEMKTLKKETPR